MVASQLCQNGHADSATQRKRLSAQAIRRAAEMLGNTATVCRNYYVHPLVIEAHLQGTLLERCRSFRPRRRLWSSPSEQLLQHLLNTPG